MTVRVRKFIGAIGLMVLVTVWAFVAMAIAQFPLIFDNRAVALIYYAIAGIGWVLPAMPLVRWMSRPDSDASP